MTRALTIPTLLVSLALTACGESTEPTQSQAPAKSTWLLTSEPADAASIVDAKANVEEGDQVVVFGRIGGRVEPISADSPVFVIVDLELPHCGQLPDDQCQTPWDYCCEPRDTLTAHSATVQLVDANGAPLDIDPVAGGLSPLDEVVVVGTVGPRPSEEVLTIRATGVHRRGS